MTSLGRAEYQAGVAENVSTAVSCVTWGGMENEAVATNEARPARADEALRTAALLPVSDARPDETSERMDDL